MAARQTRYHRGMASNPPPPPSPLLASLAARHSKTGLAWRKSHDFESRVIQIKPQPIINRMLQWASMLVFLLQKIEEIEF